MALGSVQQLLFSAPLCADGELVSRPKEPAIMASEYVGMPDRTPKAWCNLWFHAGDSAKLDNDGNKSWLARLSEPIFG